MMDRKDRLREIRELQQRVWDLREQMRYMKQSGMLREGELCALDAELEKAVWAVKAMETAAVIGREKR